MPLTKYKLVLTPEQYIKFKTNPATRLYVHTWNDVELTIDTGTSPYVLQQDLVTALGYVVASQLYLPEKRARW